MQEGLWAITVIQWRHDQVQQSLRWLVPPDSDAQRAATREGNSRTRTAHNEGDAVISQVGWRYYV